MNACIFETYLGMWSPDQRARVTALLASLGVRFEFLEGRHTEEDLREWCAWDASSAAAGVAFDLFVPSDDIEKIGTKLVEMFPERTYGGWVQPGA